MSKTLLNNMISFIPLDTNAACILSPKLKPLHNPDAIAITFFTAPPNCTPIRSSEVYTLNSDDENIFCK